MVEHGSELERAQESVKNAYDGTRSEWADYLSKHKNEPLSLTITSEEFDSDYVQLFLEMASQQSRLVIHASPDDRAMLMETFPILKTQRVEWQ